MDSAALCQNLEDIKTNVKDIKESQLIFELINGRQTPIGVVQAISQHVPSPPTLKELQSMIIDLAIDVPFAQATLVPLLEAFYNCPNKEIQNGIWGTFGMNEGDIYSSLMHDEHSVFEYLNINGFEAQIWQTMGNGAADSIYSSVIVTLARSVETEKADGNFHHADVEVAAACLWIIHASKRAWRLSKEEDRADEEAQDRRGELWTGQRGYSVQRWQLWKRRFEDVVAGRVEGVGEETKRLAAAAVANMEVVEAVEPSSRCSLAT